MIMKERIDNFGSIFRFLTPILIAIIGYVTIQFLSSISLKFDRIDVKFDTFLAKYEALDKRVDKLEYKVYDDGGNHGIIK